MILWIGHSGECESQNSGELAKHQKATTAALILDPLCICLTGTEHRWQIRYPAARGEEPAIDLLQAGRDLHVPVGTSVRLILTSTDYIYTLGIPEFGLKEIAVPDLEFQMAFRPMQVGQYRLIGEELCGSPESQGPGQLIVEPQAEFQAWLQR